MSEGAENSETRQTTTLLNEMRRGDREAGEKAAALPYGGPKTNRLAAASPGTAGPHADHRRVSGRGLFSALGGASRFRFAILRRLFGGYTDKEVVEALSVPFATVRRDWEFTRCWLADLLRSLAQAGAKGT
jgi:ECF sigma factor